MNRLYLIRHSLTEGNERKLYYGATDLPLTEAGRALCQSLRGTYVLREPVDFATSGMLRAEETLRLIFGDIPHEIIRDLREAEMGEFEMHSYEELKDNPNYQAWLSDATGAFVIPGGESNAAVMRRVSECIARLIHREHDLFVVCHGGVIGCAMTSCFPNSGKSFYDWIPHACRGFAIDFQDGQPTSWVAI